MPHQLEDSAECRAVRPAFEPGAAATMGIGVFPSSPTDEWWTMLRADLADEETVEERHSSLLVDPA